MNENEVIIVDGISNADYDSLIMDCVKYAIISLPFTVDRIGLHDSEKRALNIAKGKIAEATFIQILIFAQRHFGPLTKETLYSTGMNGT